MSNGTANTEAGGYRGGYRADRLIQQEVWDLGKEVIGMLKAQPPPG